MDELINESSISVNFVCNVSAGNKKKKTKEPASTAKQRPVVVRSSDAKKDQQATSSSKPTKGISAIVETAEQKRDEEIIVTIDARQKIGTVTTTHEEDDTATFEQQDDIDRAYERYHAKPYELDRRVNAMFRIRPSHSSKHIFTNAELEEENTTTATTNPFERMGVNSRFIPALTRMSYTRPTSIQCDAIPKLLAASNNSNTTNLCIQCETGSGKTIAYLLPIVQSIVDSISSSFSDANANKKLARTDIGTRAIIICPTRELATQTFLVASQLLQHSYPYLVPGCLSGGEKRQSEKARLRKGITILIATPGRLLDHLVKTECFTMSLREGQLAWLVLDEVDRLLDMGLKCQIQEIVERLVVIDKSASQQRLCNNNNKNKNYWKSVLVSATVTSAVLTLAKSILGEETTFIWSQPAPKQQKLTTTDDDEIKKTKNQDAAAEDYSHAAPHQLSQLYMVVSSKLRLAALTSFLVARVRKGHSVVVFMSTCDSVDFHHLLFTKTKSIMSSSADSENDNKNNGIFGSSCALLKLHGNILHSERQQVIKQLSSSTQTTTPTTNNILYDTVATTANIINSDIRSYVLFATDVAARGLNLPKVDWIVQYDAPCEVTDYVHRVGRSARAGNAGHAILFLLPSEQDYVHVLKSHGLGNVTALSLSATLQTAAKLCPMVLTQAATAADINDSGTNSNNKTGTSRSGEAFALGILRHLEECVSQDSNTGMDNARKSAVKNGGNKRQESKAGNKDKNAKKDDLLSLARQAFSAYIRAYPTKEKAVKHIFAARALHLGHVARSFALKESPIAVTKTSKKEHKKSITCKNNDNNNNNNKRDNTHLAFDNIVLKKKTNFLNNLTGTHNNNVMAGGQNGKRSTKKRRENQTAMTSSARQYERDFSEFA